MEFIRRIEMSPMALKGVSGLVEADYALTQVSPSEWRSAKSKQKLL